MIYGVSYYPEQKSSTELEHDLKLLIASGMDFVRMGEFAWCRFEKTSGVFDFQWLDIVLDRLGQHGMKSIICTPTACPPVWMVEKYPDMMYVDNRGFTRPFGGRRHYCYNHSAYRELCRIIAEKIGRHYGRHPGVLGFQIDNELAQESTGRCHCPHCRQAFQHWLEEKYGTIERLNREMGTVFWSQEYDRFDQIPIPINSIEPGTEEPIYAYYDNPSLRLEFERFASDSQILFQDEQLTALRSHTDKIITTNGTGLSTNSIDYYKSFRNLDIYAFDLYPGLRDTGISSFPYAFGRSVKGGEFWVLEFVSGGGHCLRGAGRLQPYPGALGQAVIHACASGASLLAHFQFRSFPYGAEQLNYSIVDTDGIPRRTYNEMQKTARELKKLAGRLEGTRVSADVAILFDYDSLWALKIKPIQQKTFDYTAFIGSFYDKLVCRGYNCDVISREHDFNQYTALIIPALFVCPAVLAAKIRDYVDRGGIVIATFLTSVKNEFNAGTTQSLPGGLSDLFGIIATEVEPVFERTREVIIFGNGKKRKNLHWSEVLELHGAEPLAIYGESYKKGLCAVSCHEYGCGKAYYIGTGFPASGMAGTIVDVLLENGLAKVPFTWDGCVECITRDSRNETFYLLFNFEKKENPIRCGKPMKDVLSGKPADREILLQPKGWAILTG